MKKNVKFTQHLWAGDKNEKKNKKYKLIRRKNKARKADRITDQKRYNKKR